jgi:hypothetical protein
LATSRPMPLFAPVTRASFFSVGIVSPLVGACCRFDVNGEWFGAEDSARRA